MATSPRRRPEPSHSAPDYQALFENAPGLFLVLDPDLVIRAVTEAYLAATMTQRDRILGRHIFDVFPDNPDDAGATGVSNLRASLERVRSDLVPDTMAVQQYDIRRPESEGGGFEERFWSPVNSPVLDDGGRLAWIIHRVEDVTAFMVLRRRDDEQRALTDDLRTRTAQMEADVLRRAQDLAKANRELQRANVKLRKSEVFLNSVLENLPNMVFVKDAGDLRFVRFNKAGEDLLGYPQSDLIGRNDYDLFPAAEADAFTAKDREVLADNRIIDIPEEPIATASGRRTLHTKKIPIFDEAGNPIYLLGISEDITERKRADDELQAARLAAEVANQAKTEFLSRVSHELRTPLNAVLGFSQLLELDDLTEDQRENVAYISQAGRHLLDLINEVLDISRIESGRLAISLEPVHIRDLVAELVALLGPAADHRRVTIDDSLMACTSYVSADRQRLKQVMLNLLSNAIKYNRDGGSVTVSCESSGANHLRVAVSDTGYGIPPELQDQLFRPFERLGAERGSVEGTGMGLVLSKGLMEAMHGHLGFESQLDAGSTFWVELAVTEGPIEILEKVGPPAALPSRRSGAGRDVVVHIEDNASNVELVEQILGRRPGTVVLSAATGEAGISLAREHRPGLILLDLHLPDLPGRQVLRRLRAFPETRNTPVFIVTADASRGVAERLKRDGATEFITKPLDVVAFLQQVDETLAGAMPGA